VKIRSVLVVLVALVSSLALVPVLLLGFITGAQKPVLAAGKGFMILACRLLGLRVTILGREDVDPRTQHIFMANHQSFLDGPLLYALIPGWVRVVLKKEVFRIPVIGQAMRQVDFISVDRKGLKGGRRSLDRAAQLMSRRGYSYLIFPEGTRTRDGRLQAFKRGGFFLALEAGVPIVPVTIDGTRALMPRGSPFIRSGPITIAFHGRVETRGSSLETLPALMDRVRRAIASGLGAKENPS
jgi:1-acyl-sn-glycerol-3-phosphate acyltransferase